MATGTSVAPSTEVRTRPVIARSTRAPRVTFHAAEVRTRVGLPAIVAGAVGGAVAAATAPGPLSAGIVAPVALTSGAVLGWACACPDPSTPAGRAERLLRAIGGSAAVGVATRSAASALIAAAVLVVIAATVRRTSHRAPVIDLRDRPEVAIPVPLEGLPACRAVKRGVDVAVTSVVLFLTLPVLLLAALAIRVDSPGGVLYRQTRLGRAGRPFQLLKLRTMHVDNDDSEHLRYVQSLIDGGAQRRDFYKITGDRRVTRVGAVLRRFSIDELPQLVNVLRGDMSLVGPRPPLPAEVAMYGVADWDRLACTPGMTGLWQVSGRSHLSFAEMVQLDRDYVARWTPQLDLLILARTPRAVFAQETA